MEFEPLPFTVDPLESLRPGGPDARLEGNVWGAGAACRGRPAAAASADRTPEVDRRGLRRRRGRRVADGQGDGAVGLRRRRRRASPPPTWSSTRPSSSTPRAITRWRRAARWPTGRTTRCYLHCSTQSVVRTVDAVARWVGIEPSKVVLICEYTGGGFGSKGGGAVSMAIPGVLSKKVGAPVMMRVSREEESYFGRARTNMTGRARVGFRKDGRITALDLFIVQDNGPYGPMGDHRSAGNAASLVYQPPAMRWRAVNVFTNTPPRTQQRSPGPMQANGILEGILTKAGKQLGVDQVALRRINAPEGKALYGPPTPEGTRRYVTGAFVKDALDRGAQQFDWTDARDPVGTAAWHQGARRRRGGRPARRRLGGLRRPDDPAARWPAPGAVGRRQSGHALVHRSGARRRRRAGAAVGQGRGRLGQHQQGPAVVVSVGGQPDHPRDDPRQPGRRRTSQAAAADVGRPGARRTPRGLHARR